MLIHAQKLVGDMERAKKTEILMKQTLKITEPTN
jgi:hypothetical protein